MNAFGVNDTRIAKKGGAKVALKVASGMGKAPKGGHKPKGKPKNKGKGGDHKSRTKKGTSPLSISAQPFSDVVHNRYVKRAAITTAVGGTGALGYMAYSDNKR